MFFRIRNVLFCALAAALITACDFINLEVGESAHLGSQFILKPQSDYCAVWDYKKELLSYFVKPPADGGEESAGERLKQAFSCIIFRMGQGKDALGNERLSRGEAAKLIDFFKTDDFTPIINHILKPEYFDSYIMIKNNLIYILRQKQSVGFVKRRGICAKPEDDTAFSKTDIDTLSRFVGNLSEFFLKIEKEADEMHQMFLTIFGSSMLFSDFESDVGRDQFLAFLAVYVKKKFPLFFLSLRDVVSDSNYYADFLDAIPVQDEEERRRRDEEIAAFREKRAAELAAPKPQSRRILQMFYDLQIFDEKYELMRKETAEPFLHMARLPSFSSDEVTVQSMKYILLNLYIAQALIFTYDSNFDSKLNPVERQALRCSMTPVLYVIVSKLLEDGIGKPLSAPLRLHLDADSLFDYIFYHQNIPSGWQGHAGYFWRRWVSKRDLKKFSYIEASRLTASLFSILFESQQGLILDYLKAEKTLQIERELRDLQLKSLSGPGI